MIQQRTCDSIGSCVWILVQENEQEIVHKEAEGMDQVSGGTIQVVRFFHALFLMPFKLLGGFFHSLIYSTSLFSQNVLFWGVNGVLSEWDEFIFIEGESSHGSDRDRKRAKKHTRKISVTRKPVKKKDSFLHVCFPRSLPLTNPTLTHVREFDLIPNGETLSAQMLKYQVMDRIVGILHRNANASKSLQLERSVVSDPLGTESASEIEFPLSITLESKVKGKGVPWVCSVHSLTHRWHLMEDRGRVKERANFWDKNFISLETREGLTTSFTLWTQRDTGNDCPRNLWSEKVLDAGV